MTKKNKPAYMKSSYKPSRGYTDPELQILNNSSETGYAVGIPNKTAENTNTWNAVLMDYQGRRLKMWVYEIAIDFGMSGTSSQSRYRRQFFPRSFNQTNVSVIGQMPNQKEYNKLAAFVRESHSTALNSNHSAIYQTDASGNQSSAAAPSPQLLKLIINPYGPKGSSLDKTLPNEAGSAKKFKETKGPKNIKGTHNRMVFDGYIKNIASGAEKFNFAPEFRFDFVVAQAYLNGNTGLYDDALNAGSQLSSISSLIKNTGFNGMYQPTGSKPVANNVQKVPYLGALSSEQLINLNHSVPSIGQSQSLPSIFNTFKIK
jgi:hypothetical protein